MAILIGIDEAGYGPNLGPLVIGATVWRIASPAWQDIYSVLHPAVASPSNANEETIVRVGDSKQLYSPQTGLSPLENSVLACAQLASKAFSAETNNSDLNWIERLSPDTWAEHCELPWYQSPPSSIPEHGELASISAQSHALEVALAQTEIELLDIALRVIEPAQFNRLCDAAGNKASVLSTESIRLLDQVMQPFDSEPVFATCDRHGGRAKYYSLLQQQFADDFIEVRGESARESVYSWGPENRRAEVRFCVGGESTWEVAWASMFAKYTRELAMHRFNEYWRGHCPDIKPTKGYPVDAKRFREEIQDKCNQLDFPEESYWRQR